MSHEALIDALASRFGLVRRDDWDDLVPRVADEIGRTRGLSQGHVLARALVDEEVRKSFVSALTVNESSFLRHPEHYEPCVRSVRALAQVTKGPLVIWSAGCSRGEEAYSIAIVLRDALTEKEWSRVHIIGTDVSDRVVSDAHRAVYGNWALRTTDQRTRKRHFDETGHDQFRPCAALREVVSFNQGSLQSAVSRFERNSLAAIFFRNVSIYLQRDVTLRLYEQFDSLLAPGGRLFVSPSDRQPGPEHFERDPGILVVYDPRRHLEDPEEFGTTENLRLRAGQRRSTTPRWGRLSPRLTPLPPRSTRTHRLSIVPIEAPSPGLASEVAIRIGLEKLAIEPEAAAEHFRSALFSKPEDHLARYWYALSLFNLGAHRRCESQLNVLVQALTALPIQGALSDAQTTVGELLRAVRDLKEQVA